MAQTTRHGPAAGARQTFYLQFVTVPTADTRGTAMILHFDDERYFFGQLGEGFQRACIQRGIGLKKLRNIFLSGTTQWQTNGGLTGFILSLADIQLRAEDNSSSLTVRQRLHIHGAPKLLHSLACTRRFVFRTGMPLTVHENTGLDFKWQEEPTYSDENVRVWSIPVPAQRTLEDQYLAAEKSSDSIQGLPRPEANGEPSSPNVAQEQALRKKVVSDMFESDWRRDRLFQSPFKDVQMPATVWIRHPETKELQGFTCVSHESAPEINPDQTVLVRAPWPASLVGELPTTSNLPSSVSMSYIVKGYPQRGTFDPEKAKQLGIKPGPAYAELTRGRPFTFDDGTVITPEMVLGPSRQGKGFALFDVPSIFHLARLREVLETQPATMLEGLSAVVWTLGSNVGAQNEFQAVLSSLPNVKHIVNDVDRSPNRVAYESVALSSLLTASVIPAQFPALHFDNVAAYQSDAAGDLTMYNSPITEKIGVSVPEPGVKISVQPAYSVDEGESQQAFDDDTIEEEFLAAALRQLRNPQKTSDATLTDLTEPEIVTLGTGSALPSKYRNVSATLIRMPGNQGNYLLDCGENTIGQLRRIYSAPELQSILTDLRAIWISHLHADHHLGTIPVLLERAKAFERLGSDADRAIYLISEANMHEFMHEYSSVEPSLITDTGMVPIVCSQFTGTTLHGQPFSFNGSPHGLRKVESVRVSHCAGAQAVSMTFEDGFKLSYSGDCRPSGKFCEIGKDSDVLIHEATFDNDLEGDARAKKHSTTAEALGVALKMRAKNVVLTHFSQRYHKVPNFENMKLPDEMQFEEGNTADDDGPVDDGVPPTTSQPDFSSVVQLNGGSDNAVSERLAGQKATSQMHIAVAFDYMRFKVSEIAGLKAIYPKIQALFDEQEAKADKIREEVKKKMEEDLERKKQKHNVSKKGQDKSKREERRQKAQQKMNESASNGSVVGTVTGEADQHSYGTGAEAEARQVQNPTNAPALQADGTSLQGSITPPQPLSKNELKRRAKAEARKERDNKRMKQEQSHAQKQQQPQTQE